MERYTLHTILRLECFQKISPIDYLETDQKAYPLEFVFKMDNTKGNKKGNDSLNIRMLVAI